MTRIDLSIGVNLERTTGKFISKDDLYEALVEELGEPSTVSVDDSEYEVTDFEIEMDVPTPAPKKEKKPAFPKVKEIEDALVEQGMTPQEARKTIRVLQAANYAVVTRQYLGLPPTVSRKPRAADVPVPDQILVTSHQPGCVVPVDERGEHVDGCVTKDDIPGLYESLRHAESMDSEQAAGEARALRVLLSRCGEVLI